MMPRLSRFALAMLVAFLLVALAFEGAASRVDPLLRVDSRTLLAVPLHVPSGVAPWPGLIEQAWQLAPELDAPLRAGRQDGTALTVRLRAVYTPSTLYLWLRWPDDLSHTASLSAQ